MKITTRIKCLKYMVYSFIILLSISGGVQIVFGGALVWSHIGHLSIVENKFWAPSTVLMCLGPITLIMCWIGWNATANKKRSSLMFFSAVLVVLVCVQFLVVGWAIAMRDTLPGAAELHVDNSYAEFVIRNIKLDKMHRWNRLQSELKCCGVDGPADYRRATSSVPWSCCARPENPEDSSCTTVYQRGCLHVLANSTKDKLLMCALVALVVALVQSLGIFCVIQLGVLIGRSQKRPVGTDPEHLQTTQPNRSQRPPKEMLPLAPGKLNDQNFRNSRHKT